jgi:hypothetical protein
VVSHIVAVYVSARLKAIAKLLFDEIPYINVLSFGTKGWPASYIAEQDPIEQLTYIRGQLHNLGGRVSEEAVEVDNRTARDIEPAAVILDIDTSNPDILFLKSGQDQ